MDVKHELNMVWFLQEFKGSNGLGECFMVKKYCVKLSEEERQKLLKIVSSGETSARKITRARILLKADCGPFGPGWDDVAISKAFDVAISTIWRIRKRYAENGLEDALNQRKPERKYPRKIDENRKAQLMALLKIHPPQGFRRWTLRLIADQTIRMGWVDSISHETIRILLKEKEGVSKQ